MKRFPENYAGIMSAVKTMYYVSKIAGLAPFGFTLSLDRGVQININIYSNILSVIWTVVMLCILLGGTVCYFSVIVFSRDTSALYVTAFMISFPLSIFMAFTAIFMNLTVNRRKLCELCNKLNDIYRNVMKYGVSKRNICFEVEMVLLLLVLIPFLCLDTWLWRERMGITVEATLRLSHLIQFLIVIQFCVLTQFVQQSLNNLKKALTTSVEYEYERYVTAKECLNNQCSDVSSINIISIPERLPTTHNLTGVEHVSQQNVISDKSIKACTLLEIRCMYGRIYEAVGCINSMYGFSLLLELVRNVVSVIVNVLLIMKFLRNPMDESTLYFYPSRLYSSLATFWVLIFISREMAITVSCHIATSEAKKIQDNVQCILLRQHVRTEILEQLKMFSTQLTVNRIEFTAFGFFTLNLSTLSTCIASVITYIVVLDQMK
jgi:hypothetical protein